MLSVFDMKTKTAVELCRGMTLLEVLVVMVVLFVLAGLILPDVASNGAKGKAMRISCINNLKQLGTAYRVWKNDNGDKYPMEQTESLGGMQEIFSNSASAGRFAYLPYTIMQNELGQSPKVVLCPSDERIPNTNFYWGKQNTPKEISSKWPSSPASGSFDNTNVSYFCGVGANDTYPQSILGGDRNLGNGGVINVKNGNVASPEQDPNYGISGTTANPDYPCGADAIVNTNGEWVFAFVSGGGGRVGCGLQSVGWSAKIHSAGNTAGAGNIMLGDGSAQQCTSAGLRKTWLANGINSGNFAKFDTNHSGARGDIRLLFP